MKNAYRIRYISLTMVMIFGILISFQTLETLIQKNSNNVAFATELQEVDIEGYLQLYTTTSSSTTDEEKWPYSAIEYDEKEEELSKRYYSFNWKQSKTNNNSIANTAGRNPLSVQASYNSANEDIEYGDFVVEKALRNEFPYADVWDGLIAAKQEDKSITSDYGGCGPIAAIGAFDFFARTLGYDDTIGDLHKSDNRIDLAKNVFLSINTYVLPSDKGTLTLPSDYEEGFNNLAKKYGIPVTATSHGLSIGGKREEYLELIKTQIDNGMPVTMFTAVTNGKKGVFAGHYVTICSYEEWIGTEIDGESTKRLYLFGAKTNGSKYYPQFVSEDILDVSGVGLITYEVEYGGAQDIPAVAFATTFINDEGQGQYFFYEKSAPITLANGYAFSTKRLRCSYIENQYLTISANRKSNSGTFDGKAYLQFGFYNDVKKD